MDDGQSCTCRKTFINFFVSLVDLPDYNTHKNSYSTGTYIAVVQIRESYEMYNSLGHITQYNHVVMPSLNHAD